MIRSIRFRILHREDFKRKNKKTPRKVPFCFCIVAVYLLMHKNIVQAQSSSSSKDQRQKEK